MIVSVQVMGKVCHNILPVLQEDYQMDRQTI